MRFSNGSQVFRACVVAALVAAAAVPLSARAETSVGVRVGTSGFEFGFLYNDYYRADERTVTRCSEWMSEPDMVVALHLARVSGVDLDIILDWRRGGLTWYDVTHRCRQDTYIYHVALASDPGPPYGRAWGYWRQHPKRDLRLSDDEIRHFTTLRALSDYSRRAPSDVLRDRRAGKSPREIAGNLPFRPGRPHPAAGSWRGTSAPSLAPRTSWPRPRSISSTSRTSSACPVRGRSRGPCTPRPTPASSRRTCICSARARVSRRWCAAQSTVRPIAAALGLGPHQSIILAQTVGYPRGGRRD